LIGVIEYLADLTTYQPNGEIDTFLHVSKTGRICLKKEDEHLAEEGFPMMFSTMLWMLVPYTETDPIWQKIGWDESVAVEGSLTLIFRVEKLSRRD
jgi:hypothetical protein